LFGGTIDKNLIIYHKPAILFSGGYDFFLINGNPFRRFAAPASVREAGAASGNPLAT